MNGLCAPRALASRDQVDTRAVRQLLIDQVEVVFVLADALEAGVHVGATSSAAWNRASASAISIRPRACGSSSTMRMRMASRSGSDRVRLNVVDSRLHRCATIRI